MDIIGLDGISVGVDAGSFDDIFEFSDIAGPVVVEEEGEGFWGDLLRSFFVFIGVILEEFLSEEGDIFGSFS